ncbi:MAG: tetratricopeptide repeat protein [Oligoflexia bacterium]|nr:tetratricopeptide repeat protein [Oligoflexia bacterium]
MQLALSATPMEAFKKKLEKETKPLELAKAAFGLGVLYYNENEKIKSKEHFELAIKHGTRLLDYANFYLGLIHVENKNYNEAKKYFELVVKEQPQSVRKVEAELQLALIAKQQEQWAEALRLLKYLARKYRGDIKHKDILVSYFEVASSKNQKQEACQAALLLYTKYPTHPIDPTASGCSVSLRDQERRFTQLLLSAEFDQIRVEIQKLTAKIRQDSKAHPQEMGFYETQLGE